MYAEAQYHEDQSGDESESLSDEGDSDQVSQAKRTFKDQIKARQEFDVFFLSRLAFIIFERCCCCF